MDRFQFTRPAWGATQRRRAQVALAKFQFTRPAWGATIGYQPVPLDMEFQFTRPAWGATGLPAWSVSRLMVSIHAPRVGRDFAKARKTTVDTVSIHAPRVGRDSAARPMPSPLRFQFTRPAWGAT